MTTADMKRVAPDNLTLVSMIQAARVRISGFAVETPLARITEGPEKIGSSRLHLKLENLQKTGSFKSRGAANRIFSLSVEEAGRGVITSSTGNHGLGVAAAAQDCGMDVEIFISTQVGPEKYSKMQAYGARIRQVGDNPLDAELAARKAADESRRTYVSPYNDPLVIAGQGTIAIELVQQLPLIDAVYVAVGGGGLVSGIGSYLNFVSPRTIVVGCWPENSRVLYECLKAGRIVKYPETPTLSESTAGGVEPGSITFELCQRVVGRHLLVSESEILSAMRWAKARGWIVEGAAGVAIAGAFKDKQHLEGKNVVIICCGGNLSSKVARQLE
jgi:threonine dehydratase